MALAFSTRNVVARPQAAPRAAGRQLRMPVRAAAAASAEVPGQYAQPAAIASHPSPANFRGSHGVLLLRRHEQA